MLFAPTPTRKHFVLQQRLGNNHSTSQSCGFPRFPLLLLPCRWPDKAVPRVVQRDSSTVERRFSAWACSHLLPRHSHPKTDLPRTNYCVLWIDWSWSDVYLRVGNYWPSQHSYSGIKNEGFRCVSGNDLEYVTTCWNGCVDGGHGRNDYCA